MVTSREQKLLNKLDERGYLKLEDFQAEFSMNYWKAMVKKFMAMKVMVDSGIVGRFNKK